MQTLTELKMNHHMEVRGGHDFLKGLSDYYKMSDVENRDYLFISVDFFHRFQLQFSDLRYEFYKNIPVTLNS